MSSVGDYPGGYVVEPCAVFLVFQLRIDEPKTVDQEKAVQQDPSSEICGAVASPPYKLTVLGEHYRRLVEHKRI